MRPRLIGLLALLVLGVTAVSAQTYNLPNVGCSVQASNYLFCSDSWTETINAHTYVISTNYDITNVYQWASGGGPTSGTTTGNLNLQDVTTYNYTYSNVPVSVTFSLNADGTHHVSVSFSGTLVDGDALNGTLNFDVFFAYPGCRPPARYCYKKPYLENAVLVLQ